MSLSSKIIRVPVTLVEGRWEFLYGGAVKVVEGAMGELHLNRSYFTDTEFLNAMTEQLRVSILEEGTDLRVSLSIQSDIAPEHSALFETDTRVWHPSNDFSYYHSRFVSIHLGGPTLSQLRDDIVYGGLSLLLEGMEPRSIESGIVHLPEALNLEPVDSLNYAFTLLSEIFEPWRKSHTGSIYKRVYYRESDGSWYSLEHLRNKAMVSAERKLMTRLWANVTDQLKFSQL